ncbi:hypothetical protein OKA04_21000 [Luteolibacter flavescens]|uniref:Uncharacterized protein n=1 Tax=Luteolibacter flavescens TaxID=1859460 RepID=A0ABT3FUG0_9BACT|nr:hypothetical protein [Luteolibacter flavescens]MCW1887229.1 hypothetical protein [Luteolibacter flavescens]
MAWRIDEHVIRGEIDNRTRGKVTGRIWFVDREEPVTLELEGNAWRDLAGHLLRFTNPEPKPGLRDGFATLQDGVAGDITASRKVKVPDVSMEELLVCYEKKQPFPWHWGNSLYLEWFSQYNGRVVIETAGFTLELDDTAVWTMSEEEEVAQRQANAEAMTTFMDRMLAATVAGAGDEDDDDAPQSKAEAEADAEAARMDLLLDRVQARLEREGHEDFERVFDEERERLKRERGEVEPELTPEEKEERQRWIEEMNQICAEAIEEAKSDDWKEPESHPLVERCMELGIRMHHEVGEWLDEPATQEHPLLEVIYGTQTAAAKLSGALATTDEWPPEDWIAGSVLVRLKKVRECLRDALSGLDSADQEGLATPIWRAFSRKELDEILGEVEGMIVEVRDVLKEGE